MKRIIDNRLFDTEIDKNLYCFLNYGLYQTSKNRLYFYDFNAHKLIKHIDNYNILADIAILCEKENVNPKSFNFGEKIAHRDYKKSILKEKNEDSTITEELHCTNSLYFFEQSKIFISVYKQGSEYTVLECNKCQVENWFQDNNIDAELLEKYFEIEKG